MCRARDPLYRARDISGVANSGPRGFVPRARPYGRARLRVARLYIPRARPFGRGRRTMVRCTARAAGARIAINFQRACNARARRARQMRWASAHWTSCCRPQSRTPWPQRSRTAPAWTRSCRASTVIARRRELRVPPRAAGPSAIQGLICLQRETDRFSEEWERTREPRAEGLSALIAIETLRTLALRTMAELGAREEPVATEDLARLALALNRIESADRLRIEREQARRSIPPPRTPDRPHARPV